MSGVVGAVGDQLTWACNFAFFSEMIGLSMLVNAVIGSPPNGLTQSDMYFVIYGMQLVLKDAILGICAIYVCCIRLAKWCCWRDFDNTPVWKDATSMKHSEEPLLGSYTEM
jgi:hypothetical protein